MTPHAVAVSPVLARQPRLPLNLQVIGVMAFLTVVDLFAAQAILPALAAHFAVTPAAMGAAVNACTIGMAVSGLATALWSAHIPRRAGVAASLIALAVPTALLALAPNLAVFAALRVAQGVFMAAAFTLTLAHLGERCSASASPSAFAAYVTGNVASNLLGRLIAAGLVDGFGLEATFVVFAALNLLGALLALAALSRAPADPALMTPRAAPFAAVARYLSDGALRAGFAIGFSILFAFVGVFSYVSFELAGPRFGLAMAALGLAYLVFLPAMVTTPAAGSLTRRFGARVSIAAAMALACLGLALTLVHSLPLLLAGLALVGVGTFFAQAAATGFVNRAAKADRGAASGLYLAFYYLGGLAGGFVLGQIYMLFGWTGCVVGAGLVLAAGAALGLALPSMTERKEDSHAHA
jgi:predicted MFS family arabinose efflux permease